MRISDWSSDVCSSDLARQAEDAAQPETTDASDERPTRRRAPRRAAAPSPQLELTPPENAAEEAPKPRRRPDRESVQEGKSVSVWVDLGRCRSIQKKQKCSTAISLRSYAQVSTS